MIWCKRLLESQCLERNWKNTPNYIETTDVKLMIQFDFGNLNIILNDISYITFYKSLLSLGKKVS